MNHTTTRMLLGLEQFRNLIRVFVSIFGNSISHYKAFPLFSKTHTFVMCLLTNWLIDKTKSKKQICEFDWMVNYFWNLFNFGIIYLICSILSSFSLFFLPFIYDTSDCVIAIGHRGRSTCLHLCRESKTKSPNCCCIKG